MDRSELAYIGLGANVGSAKAALERAVAALAASPGASLEEVSRLYRTRPVGAVEQGDFLNAVVALRVPAGGDPASGAMTLLAGLKRLEQALGRQARERWGPREIDLDLLLFGAHELRLERAGPARSEDPARSGVQWLQVPHPSASTRLFVLAPLADLAPGLEPPRWGLTVAGARDRALEVEGADAVAAVGTWDPVAVSWAAVTGPASGALGE